MADGIRVLEKALAGFSASLGPKHQSALKTKMHLVAGYLRAGKIDDAIRLSNQVFTSAGHRDDLSRFRLSATNALADAYRVKGDPQRSIQLLEKAVA